MDCLQLEDERKCLESKLNKLYDDDDDVISGEKLNMLNPYPLYTIKNEPTGVTYIRLYREKEIFWILHAYVDTPHVYRVSVPNDAIVNIHWHRFETETYKVEETFDIGKFINMNPLKAVKHCDWALKYVNPQTYEICKEAVTYNPLSLQYVERQTEELCLIAINHKRSGWLALEFVKEQTHEMCMLAVSMEGLALRFVADQTDDIRNVAIQNTRHARHYVKYS